VLKSPRQALPRQKEQSHSQIRRRPESTGTRASICKGVDRQERAYSRFLDEDAPATGTGVQLLHPFDQVTLGRWLKVRVVVPPRSPTDTPVRPTNLDQAEAMQMSLARAARHYPVASAPAEGDG